MACLADCQEDVSSILPPLRDSSASLGRRESPKSFRAMSELKCGPYQMSSQPDLICKFTYPSICVVQTALPKIGRTRNPGSSSTRTCTARLCNISGISVIQLTVDLDRAWLLIFPSVIHNPSIQLILSNRLTILGDLYTSVLRIWVLDMVPCRCTYPGPRLSSFTTISGRARSRSHDQTSQIALLSAGSQSDASKAGCIPAG
jgi:hypothetical protein